MVIYLRILDSVLTLDETIFLTCDGKGCNSISESKNMGMIKNNMRLSDMRYGMTRCSDMVLFLQ